MAIPLFYYLNYRDFIRDAFLDRKATQAHVSHRFFARMAGLGSPSYLKMVIDGKRNLSPGSVAKFAKGLKLSKRETAYFETLVFLNQAKADEERDHYLERLAALRPKSNARGIKTDELAYYEKKYYVVIREMVALPHFKEDPEWIAASLSPPIRPREAEEAIKALLRLGFLTRDENNRLIQRDASLSTDPEVVSMEVCQFHRSMLNDAKAAILNIPPDLRDITSLTIPVQGRFLTLFKKKIQEFREDLTRLVNEGDPDYADVFQLNIQFFPATHTSPQKKDKPGEKKFNKGDTSTKGETTP